MCQLYTQQSASLRVETRSPVLISACLLPVFLLALAGCPPHPAGVATAHSVRDAFLARCTHGLRTGFRGAGRGAVGQVLRAYFAGKEKKANNCTSSSTWALPFKPFAFSHGSGDNTPQRAQERTCRMQESRGSREGGGRVRKNPSPSVHPLIAHPASTSCRPISLLHRLLQTIRNIERDSNTLTVQDVKLFEMGE